MIFKAFVPSVNQSIETGIVEIRVEIVESLTGLFWYPRLGWESSLFPHVNNGKSDVSLPNQEYQNKPPTNDGFLNFGSEMTTCQVLLQRSEEMKITSCEIRPVVDVLDLPYLCSSGTSVLSSSNYLHRNHTCFRDITLAPKTSTSWL
ncbi:hypothetical protein AVEN_241203-1 [Araneus ventricosus]|uniref:Uncharacterized protein n=1 Tax=Araneus ventricosus TaxID=182803 RepID=A0A4Y2D2U4_ARAVE|nr:hypothetical protein AVEN_241203-1 [Araneus ventricosus]